MVQTTTTAALQHRLRCSHLPLAVYREVAAHLRQVPGVDTILLPQSSSTFDYRLSQVGGLQITYTDQADQASRDRVDQILAYYGDRYGTWEVLSEESH